jgi:CMP-N,N'-diacetyllegionaminic acid synthase
MNIFPAVLAVIPARGGSKGVPRKNIRDLAGMPLIVHTIQAAQQAQHIARIWVSTDDEGIAGAAREAGASVPELRPVELAGDSASQLDVVLHALRRAETLDGCEYPIIILLQPTAPLRTVHDIDGSLEMLVNNDIDSVVSYCKVEREHPYYMATLDEGRPIPLLPVPAGMTARQQYPEVYLRNGAIYAVKREALLAEHSLYGKSTLAWLMDYWHSINIDSEFDLELAEFLLTRKKRGEHGAAHS